VLQAGVSFSSSAVSSVLLKQTDEIYTPELNASLFEIARSLFALERTFILGAMALNKNKSEERRAN